MTVNQVDCIRQVEIFTPHLPIPTLFAWALEGWSKGDIQCALFFLEKILKADPTHSQAFHTKIDILRNEGRIFESIDLLHNHLQRNPHDWFSFLKRGTFKIVTHYDSEGIKDILRAFDLRRDCFNEIVSFIIKNLEKNSQGLEILQKKISTVHDFTLVIVRGLYRLSLKKYWDSHVDFDLAKSCFIDPIIIQFLEALDKETVKCRMSFSHLLNS